MRQHPNPAGAPASGTQRRIARAYDHSTLGHARPHLATAHRNICIQLYAGRYMNGGDGESLGQKILDTRPRSMIIDRQAVHRAADGTWPGHLVIGVGQHGERGLPSEGSRETVSGFA
jgi:hypothetical protein